MREIRDLKISTQNTVEATTIVHKKGKRPKAVWQAE